MSLQSMSHLLGLLSPTQRSKNRTSAIASNKEDDPVSVAVAAEKDAFNTSGLTLEGDFKAEHSSRRRKKKSRLVVVDFRHLDEGIMEGPDGALGSTTFDINMSNRPPVTMTGRSKLPKYSAQDSSPRMMCVSPMALQASGIEHHQGEESSMMSGARSLRIGISRPQYQSNDDGTVKSVTSHRIGITRPSYEAMSEEDLVTRPLLPMSPMFSHFESNRKPITPPPELIRDDEDSSLESSTPRTFATEISSNGKRESRIVDAYVSDDDSVERTVHKHTARAKKSNLERHLDAEASKKGKVYSLGISMRTVANSTGSGSSTSKSGRLQLANVIPQAQQEDSDMKVFLLLLNPKRRIFELIELVYNSSIATLGDLLDMVPANATEKRLAKQKYAGFTRPMSGKGMTDRFLQASGSTDKYICARIMMGEILVAVPTGYTAKECADLSRPILKNEKLRMLLARRDPLAPATPDRNSASSRHSRRKKSSRSRSSNSSVGSLGGASSRNIKDVIPPCVEEEEDYEDHGIPEHLVTKTNIREEPELEVRQALESAAEKAAATNAELMTETNVLEDPEQEAYDDLVYELSCDESEESSIQHLDDCSLDLDLLATAMRCRSTHTSVASASVDVSMMEMSTTTTPMSSFHKLANMTQCITGRRRFSKQTVKASVCALATYLTLARLIQGETVTSQPPISITDSSMGIGGLFVTTLLFCLFTVLQKHALHRECKQSILC